MPSIVDHQHLLKFAKLHCIFDASSTKAALIRAIQYSERDAGCFGNGGNRECNGSICGWREDCLVESTACRQAGASPAALASNIQVTGY